LKNKKLIVLLTLHLNNLKQLFVINNLDNPNENFLNFFLVYASISLTN